jgi:hypothetical protein
MYNQDYHTMQFCNGTIWVSMGAAGGSGGPQLISTQTASSSADIEFTNLPTSYNTLFLNCDALLPATASAYPALQVGEGATPTWQTGSNYSYSILAYTSVGSNGQNSSNTGTSIPLTWSNDAISNFGYSAKIWIDNPASSAIYKAVNVLSTYQNSTSPLFGWTWGGGVYTGDTNAVTALKVLMSSGNITSGQCSLYGMN